MKSAIIGQRSNGNIMMISHLTHIWMTRNDRQYQNAGKDVDKLEFSYIAGEKVNYYNHLVKWFLIIVITHLPTSLPILQCILDSRNEDFYIYINTIEVKNL